MTQVMTSDQSVDFVGRRAPLFWLLIRNSLFTILTLGIYRFWAKTHVRRYYWNNIEVDSDGLEYLGRPIELLIGFLIAIAILLPLGIAAGVLGFILATIRPGLEFLSNLIIFIAIAWLGYFALYRMRLYRLTRTSWRGIRGGQTGSAVRYAFLRFGLTILSFLSLGLAYPWTRMTIHRYVIPNTWFGNTAMQFTGTVRQLFRRWIPVQIVIVLLIGVLAAFSGKIIEASQLAANLQGGIIDGTASEQELAAGMARVTQLMIGLAGVLVPLYFVLTIAFLWFRVAELRYVFSNLTLAGAETTSDFRFRSVAWRAILLLVTTLALFGVLVAVITGAQTLLPVAPVGSVLLTFATLVVFFFVLTTFQHLLFWRPILTTFCRRLSISNPGELQRIAQSTKQDPKYGEGLADALAIDALPI